MFDIKRREFITLLGGAAACVAAGGARAAAGADAAHRRAHAIHRGRSGGKGAESDVRAEPPTIGLDGWSKRCRSTIAQLAALPTPFADTRRNWLRSRRT